MQLALRKVGYQGAQPAPSPFPLPSPLPGCTSAVKAAFPTSRWPKVGAAQRERPSIPHWGRGASFKTCLEKSLLVSVVLLLSCSPALLSEAILILSVPKAGPDESWNEQELLMFFSEEGFQASKLYLPKLESVQDAERKWHRASDTKGTRTSPFTGIPKSQNEAHAAAAKRCLFTTKCYRSRWKPATPWWLSTTPSLQPLLSPPAPALPQDNRKHHWPCAIYGTWLHTQLSPLQGKTQPRSKGVTRPLSHSLRTWMIWKPGVQAIYWSALAPVQAEAPWRTKTFSSITYWGQAPKQSGCGHQSSYPAAEMPLWSMQSGCELLTSGEDSRSFLGLPCRLQHFHTFPFPGWSFPVLGARLISAVSPSAKSGKKWMENRLLASATRDKKTCLDEFASDSSSWL